ncbi:hypothetical protein [Streptomyces virginiae]|uniref:hypothetical protein n=1 Tax=Streptomyces virginiae TaxID=1961 RepID=UPI0036D1D700
MDEINETAFVQTADREVQGDPVAAGDHPVDIGQFVDEDEFTEAVVGGDVRQRLQGVPKQGDAGCRQIVDRSALGLPRGVQAKVDTTVGDKLRLLCFAFNTLASNSGERRSCSSSFSPMSSMGCRPRNSTTCWMTDSVKPAMLMITPIVAGPARSTRDRTLTTAGAALYTTPGEQPETIAVGALVLSAIAAWWCASRQG